MIAATQIIRASLRVLVSCFLRAARRIALQHTPDPSPEPDLRGSSTSGPLKSRTKRSLCAKRELGDLAAAVHLQSTGGTVFRDMVTTRGRVPAMSARSGGQVLKQERVPKRRHSDTAWMVLTKLRVNLGLTIATMAE